MYRTNNNDRLQTTIAKYMDGSTETRSTICWMNIVYGCAARFATDTSSAYDSGWMEIAIPNGIIYEVAGGGSSASVTITGATTINIYALNI